MNLNEAYIKAEKGNIYYTKRGETLISLSKTIFLEKGLPVRVYYDINKDLYVFGNAFDYIHADLANGMKYHSNMYGGDEMKANISYLMKNCALFQIIPNDDFKKYDMGDGYSKGWFLKLDDLIFACRNKEYEKVRDNVPLFKDHIGDWMDVEYYLSKKNNINESVEDKILYLVRGLPGSGKSTLAKTLTKNVVEADQFLYDENGDYIWTQERVYKAHKQCQATVRKYMEEGRDKIAVANCFVKLRDMKPYKKLAEEFGYKVIIKVCKGNYGSIHNVSDETMNRMKNNFQLDESNQDNSENYYFIGKCNDTDDGMEIQDITHWDEWGNSEYYGIPEDDESIEVIDTNAFLKMIGNQPRPKKIEYCAKNKDKDIIWAYDDEGIHWFYSQSGNELFESAENDKTLRDYALKLTNICLDALVKTKYETRISNKQIQINVDKAFKKAVPMLKNSPYEYFIILVSKNDEPNASYGKTIDRKYGIITLPVFSKDPIDQALSILFKHKSMLNKLYSTYSGNELNLKINDYAIKYLKKELEKSLSNVRSKYIDILIHECTHLLDDVRRTKTYKSKEQNLKDDSGIEDYYNSPEEQNAFYQETISIFDEWANQSVGYKTFDIFWDDFIRQYRGDYNMLNDKNKRKLKKRAYAYWNVYMKD